MGFREKSLQRGWRRHQRERAIAHGLFVARLCYSGCYGHTTRDEAEAEARKWAMRLYQNPRLCGCWMCSRPRKRRKGEDRFNFQELRLRCESRLELTSFRYGEDDTSR